MKTKKRTARRRVTIAVLAILALYVVYCAAISIQLGSLVRQSNNSMGEYTGQFGISAEDFKPIAEGIKEFWENQRKKQNQK